MKELNFTHWNQDYINTLSNEDYDVLKGTEVELTDRLQDFLTAYDIRPDEYRGKRYIHAQELSPNVFSSIVDEAEFCVRFEAHTTLRGVRCARAGMIRMDTHGLKWIKLGDVPRVIDRYSDSIYRNKTPEQLQVVDQLVIKQREYMTLLDSIHQKMGGV